MAALDAKTGKQKWKLEGPDSYVCNSPLVNGDVAYVTHGGRGPTRAIRNGKEVWSAKIKTTVPSPAATNGLVFVVEGDKLTCLDAESGDEVYRERTDVQITNGLYASPLVIGDRLYVVTRSDGTLVFAAKAEFELLAQNKIAGDESIWNASPAVSDGRLFLRSEKVLYCVGKK